ncbi:R3H domain-containing nucleic acid-binding protein [Thermoflexus sp.]|uniref:R3H domain-containing nucleic acid-binding protein n=1 Tax=Thermoflexus sp. TaxID=1969742 RepID=UPI0025F85F5C|nr:R3H domain-containing nucleic acid-binding protein [Thermoflexus sp.]MDW8065555.1 R3H domain-containing nucleic acid-binding protein [Anaerolineae bacterium]MCS6963298.1 AAA family ATPase [Thermoflexus sp.]MCS7350431.1 AAA family ATPase [Thermoflexus sp.]MCX7689377.1 AAA family ATPase [Thermoflexus sp.]MDW8179882.1 R3H domain-containing nucleic acid-binding protein [Anaerolineae bacterium]
MTQFQITDDLEALLSVLPPDIARAVRDRNRNEALLEVVLDLGRYPEARYTDGEATLCPREVTEADLQYVVSRIGEFDADNRAGIQRTLHRISAIRNRRGNIIGLTCRVGRAVYGTIEIIKDIILSGKSILLLGRPGVGKTTMLREAARVLAEHKRVIIVDTSNEIGGDGDIPHPAVGRARRMQVPKPSLQHEVMIEAVENHMPEVIIIDEIGRELEAVAARTIAERGVQLIATAHGNTLENLLMNPTLSDLVGGIESVTLSDEEARRRGTQKTVLERRAPPTFDVLIEIQDRQRLLVHHDVAASVDALLRGQQPDVELRYRDEEGRIHIEKPRFRRAVMVGKSPLPFWRGEIISTTPIAAGEPLPAPARVTVERVGTFEEEELEEASWQAPPLPSGNGPRRPLRVYPLGLARNRLQRAASVFGTPIQFVEQIGEADVVITTKAHYRRHPRVLHEAEGRGIPIYVVRSNTVTQIESCLADILNLTPAEGEEEDRLAQALEEAEAAIRKILHGEAKYVDLSPQNAYIRRQQHLLARQYNLISHSYGKEPNRYVRIYAE